MSRGLIAHLLRRSLELPPHVVVRKAAGLLARTAARWQRDRRDQVLGTYTRRHTGRLQLAIEVPADRLDAGEREVLRLATEQYLAHRFDLLGSGWQCADYGALPAGIEGVRYPPDSEAQAIASSRDPARAVTRANRATARALLRLIGRRDYRHIDWQRDLRSGFRWPAHTPAAKLAIGDRPGADIKLPWELSRLQHVPQLALAALLAREQADGFRPAEVYVAEIRDQCLDFIGSNPPRHGACWGCPMDVGIRAANMILARALLAGAGFSLDEPFESALADSVAEHGAHVAAHVEWSESQRSNHFLADLAGLMFCAVALPPGDESRQWLAYAASWLVNDVIVQFHADGGCYEGSTGYHRLSAELVAYGVALLRRVLAERPDFLDALAREAAPSVRGGLGPRSSEHGALDAVQGRLRRMLAFLQAVRRPDGNMILVGDMDSGRLFRLVPRPVAAGRGDAPPSENHRDPSETLAALGGLCAGDVPAQHGVAGAVAVALAAGETWLAPSPMRRDGGPDDQVPLDGLLDEARALPAASRREREITVRGLVPQTLVFELFADFGLAVVRGDDFYLALRCANHARADAPTSHLHDDNLALELYFDGAARVSDPGTYVYTPFPALRDAYRRDGAHFAPRAHAWQAVGYTDYLFELRLLSRARCVHLSPGGVAARLESERGYVQRLVVFQSGSLSIVDSCSPGALAHEGEPIACCDGYGIRTSRPSVAL